MALFVLAVNKGLCATFRTVLIVVALVNKKPVYTKFLKSYNIIFLRLVIEFIQFLLNGFL